MLHRLADFLARSIGLLLISTAVIWQIYPVEFTSVFGITNPTPEKATFGPALGSRNAAAGLMLLVLSFKGYRNLAGTFLAIWCTCAGLEDAYLCYLKGSNKPMHLINTLIGWAVATLLWKT